MLNKLVVEARMMTQHNSLKFELTNSLKYNHTSHQLDIGKMIYFLYPLF